MIKLDKKSSGGITLRDPSNLMPIVFKCRDCGSTVRKLEETQSYILVCTSKDVDLGKKKICEYCYRLRELNGIET